MGGRDVVHLSSLVLNENEIGRYDETYGVHLIGPMATTVLPASSTLSDTPIQNHVF